MTENTFSRIYSETAAFEIISVMKIFLLVGLFTVSVSITVIVN